MDPLIEWGTTLWTHWLINGTLIRGRVDAGGAGRMHWCILRIGVMAQFGGTWMFIITTICLENSSESDIVWDPPCSIAKVNPDFRSLHPLLATIAYIGLPTSISLSMLWISPSPCCLAFNGVTHRLAAQLRSSGIYVMRLLMLNKPRSMSNFKRRVHLLTCDKVETWIEHYNMHVHIRHCALYMYIFVMLVQIV
jgi:hypothetical protein